MTPAAEPADLAEERLPSPTVLRWAAVALALSFAGFQLYTAAFGVLEQTLQRSAHLIFVLLLVPIIFSRWAAKGTRWRAGLDLLLGVGGGWSCVYLIWNYERLITRIAYVDPLTTTDLVAGTILIVAVLEICRRAVSGILSVICLLFMAYAVFGSAMPGRFGHPGLSFTDLIETMYLSPEGIFGIPLGVSATYVFVFITFGILLMRLGLMQLIMDLGLAVAGRTAGGPAKVAVLCSAMFGTISGSGLANAITTANFTIPLMKRARYTGHFAAGVESAASMGGNIMPPIMVAAAFIMADFLSVPYVEVALAALIPAVLYFVRLGSMVHFEAVRRNIGRMAKADMPDLAASLLTRGHLLIPIVVLLYVLFSGRSVMMAGMLGIASAILASYLRRQTWLTPAKALDVLVATAITALPIGAACAAMGTIVGVVAQTGLGVSPAGGIVNLADGSMALTLVLAMFASLLLGLGLPTRPTTSSLRRWRHRPSSSSACLASSRTSSCSTTGSSPTSRRRRRSRRSPSQAPRSPTRTGPALRRSASPRQG